MCVCVSILMDVILRLSMYVHIHVHVHGVSEVSSQQLVCMQVCCDLRPCGRISSLHYWTLGTTPSSDDRLPQTLAWTHIAHSVSYYCHHLDLNILTLYVHVRSVCAFVHCVCI